MIDFSKPLAALDRATSTIDRTAARVAKSGWDGDSIDLSEEFVALIQARHSFEANVKVIKTENEVSKSALKILD